MVQVMIAEGLLAETKPFEMENFKHVDGRWTNVYWDPGRRYTVPWQWGSTSFAVNTKAFGGDIDTLAILFDPPDALKGRINMLNDINDVINAGLRYLGHPRCNSNKAHLEELSQLLSNAKQHWRGLDYRTMAWLRSGQVDASQIWNGMAMRARRQPARPALRLPARRLYRLDGQRRRADGRAQPGERQAVSELHHGPGERSPYFQLCPLCQWHRRQRDCTWTRRSWRRPKSSCPPARPPRSSCRLAATRSWISTGRSGLI